MITTPHLQARFNSSFHKIMQTVSPELQKRWNGLITWNDNRSYPDIQPEIISELPPAAKATYVTLLNKLSRGTI